MAKLLLHFKWTWIGLLVPDNDHGERFISTFTDVTTKMGLGVAFTERIEVFDFAVLESANNQRLSFLTQDHINVLVYHADPQATVTLAMLIRAFETTNPIAWKVWIAVALQDFSFSGKGYRRCTKRREIVPPDAIKKVLAQDNYNIYNTVQAVACALHVAFTSKPLNRWLIQGARRLASEIAQPRQIVLSPHRYWHRPSIGSF